MRILLLLLLLPTMATAEQRMVYPADVLSVITDDWNGDGQQDRAVLVNNWLEGTADLFIYIGKDDGFVERSASPDIVWSGSMWGQQPSLEVNIGGDLQVLSTNHGMGRTRWFQTLTIAFRNNTFVIVEFLYNYYDSIDTDDVGFCKIDFLTGRGSTTQLGSPLSKFNLSANAILASDWNVDVFPEECF